MRHKLSRVVQNIDIALLDCLTLGTAQKNASYGFT